MKSILLGRKERRREEEKKYFSKMSLIKGKEKVRNYFRLKASKEV